MKIDLPFIEPERGPACMPLARHARALWQWNLVYVRFRRWAEQGVWDALLQTLIDLGLTNNWQHMMDSTSVRGNVSAAGGKESLCECSWSITRRLYEQIPCPLRQSGAAPRLHPDGR